MQERPSLSGSCSQHLGSKRGVLAPDMLHQVRVSRARGTLPDRTALTAKVLKDNLVVLVAARPEEAVGHLFVGEGGRALGASGRGMSKVTMTYDFANMIQHTCLNPGDVSATAVAADDSACLNLVEEMEEFVDKMVEETDNGATQIWDEVYKKFYLESNRVVRGLSKRQVVSRVSNIKAAQNGKDIYSMLESPKMSKVKNDVVSFF
ncbi:hypothetical protein F442_01151 [Phytophthora nicotianae P10297]|uniref:Uncharacterized protein n=1 Tax=Phytophthora nicotianae P10297 TaxID=1317064 RepID=W3A654_PHYNI|nr:hypothetical protein F442_01151 [Phytophthora nicotianae P10297]